MSMLLDLVRGRLRVPILWILIACELGAGVMTWAARRDTGTGTGARTTSSAGGFIVPTAPSDPSTIPPVVAGAQATVATGGTTSSTAHVGPVRAAAGPGAVTVSWDPLAARPQSYVVRATEEGSGDHGTLIVCGTCTSTTFRGLTNGKRYTFTVSGQTVSGSTPPLQSPAAVPGTAVCPAGVSCVAVDAATTDGTASGRMQGFLHGIDGYTDPNRILALRPTSWRGSPGKNWHTLVAPYGVQTTEVLSDDWLVATYDQAKGGAAAPWDDWNAYRSFVTGVVKKAEAEGWAPTYWAILNEPEAGLP
ncbi:MAG: fibronectin type III domain-containing protein [Acidimicrobiia bacterium]|nr:fibronectin type III domain-containing protein [Acidimicrobiia bacterium]